MTKLNVYVYICAKGYEYYLMSTDRQSMNLLDLPDELLLFIMKSMKPTEILYSLLGVNKKLDRLASSIYHTYLVNFTNTSSTDEHICMDPNVFDRFCSEILPRICQNVRILILDHWTMERALLACKYPALQSIVFSNFQSDTILACLQGKLELMMIKQCFTF